MYCIAEFQSPFGNTEVAVVHHSWFQGDTKCFWPAVGKNPSKLNKALKNGTPPDPATWTLLEARRVGNHYFGIAMIYI